MLSNSSKKGQSDRFKISNNLCIVLPDALYFIKESALNLVNCSHFSLKLSQEKNKITPMELSWLFEIQFQSRAAATFFIKIVYNHLDELE